MAKKAEDWIHRAAGMAAQFEATDMGYMFYITYTTVLGQAEDGAWIVRIEGRQTDRGEYWWDHIEFLAVSGTEEHPLVDDATNEQVAQASKED